MLSLTSQSNICYCNSSPSGRHTTTVSRASICVKPRNANHSSSRKPQKHLNTFGFPTMTFGMLMEPGCVSSGVVLFCKPDPDLRMAKTHDDTTSISDKSACCWRLFMTVTWPPRFVPSWNIRIYWSHVVLILRKLRWAGAQLICQRYIKVVAQLLQGLMWGYILYMNQLWCCWSCVQDKKMC